MNASLVAETFIDVRDLTDTQNPDERITDAGLRLLWRYRQVEVEPRLEFISQRRDGTDTRDYRATLKVIRRF
jgi:hypothetical protein